MRSVARWFSTGPRILQELLRARGQLKSNKSGNADMSTPIEALLIRLKHQEAGNWWEAVVSLGTLKAVEAFEAIIALIETDEDFSNRHVALYALAKLPDCKALKYLVNTLSSEIQEIREGAIGAIGLFAEVNPTLNCNLDEAVPILHRLLQNELNEQIAVNIIYSLAAIGTPDAKDILVSTLNNPIDNPVFENIGFRKTIEHTVISLDNPEDGA